MSQDSIAVGLLAILDNQASRTGHALADVPTDVFTTEAGGGCHSIAQIGRHLVELRCFQLRLLGIDGYDPNAFPQAADAAALLALLDRLTQRVRAAIRDHAAADWMQAPASPRPGPWGDEPTLQRVVRPLNDFTSHLGAIRAIRRILGHPAAGVQ
jgi:hypothetical protein